MAGALPGPRRRLANRLGRDVEDLLNPVRRQGFQYVTLKKPGIYADLYDYELDEVANVLDRVIETGHE